MTTLPVPFLRGLALVCFPVAASAQVVETPLVAPADPDAEFGFCVVTDGFTVVIGAPGQRVDGVPCGVAYLYERGPSGWTLEQRLDPPEPRASGMRFGHALDLEGDSLVVSAAGSDVHPFHLHEDYVRDASGEWAPLDSAGGDWYYDQVEWIDRAGEILISTGQAVGESGSRSMAKVQIGPYPGGVYHWELSALWLTIFPPESWILLLDRDADMVSGLKPAWSSDPELALFEFEGSPAGWAYRASHLASSVLPDDPNAEFYFAAALDGGRLLVGSPGASLGGQLPASAGVVSVFGGNASEPMPVDLLGHLSASDTSAGQRFGSSVALEDDVALIGTPSSAYVFQETAPGAWLELEQLAPGWSHLTSTAADRARVVLTSVDGSSGAGVASVFELSSLNVQPVADAGADRIIELSTSVRLDGNQSFDADEDELGYEWHVVATPPGSTGGVLTNWRGVEPTFYPDFPGQYLVRLVVDDGSVPSQPDEVAVLVTDPLATPIEALLDAVDDIHKKDYFPRSTRHDLRDLLDEIEAAAELQYYSEALTLIQVDVIPRVDGCANTAAPDGDDWIVECDSQQVVLDHLQPVIDILEVLTQ